MTQRAREVGAKNTNFTNPHGLPEDDHYTTAYDMALITREAIKNEKFAKYFSTNRYDMPPTNVRDVMRQFWNANYFINGYENVDGLIMSKTGWTEEAKHTLVTAAERNGVTLIAVVMFSSKQGDKYDDTMALLDYCFDNFTTAVVTKADMAKDFPNHLTLADASTAKVSEDSFMVENFTVVMPKKQTVKDLDFEFGYGTLTSGNSIATVTVETYYTNNGEKYKCGQQDISVIVNSDEIQADRSLAVNKVKRTGLTIFNILLWLLVARFAFVALRQLIIIENRRRIREKRRREYIARKQKADSEKYIYKK